MTLCALVGVTALGLSACASSGTGTHLPDSSVPLQDEGTYITLDARFNFGRDILWKRDLRGECIALADWDEDEDIDVLSSDGYGDVFLYENDGWENFTKSENPLFHVPLTYGRGCSLEVIDIDNDGDLDVLSSDGYGDVHLYRNQSK